MDEQLVETGGGTPQSSFDILKEKYAVRRAFSRAAFAILVYQLLSYGLAYSGDFLLAVLESLGLSNLPWYQENFETIVMIFLNAIPMYGIAYPIFYAIFRKDARHTPIPDGEFGFGDYLSLFCIAECFTIVGSLVGQGVISFFEKLLGHEITNALDETINSLPLWVTVLVACICAPIFEELIYRKFLIDRLSKYGKWAAIIFSSVLFGLIHGNFNQFFYAMLLGLLLGFIYTKTGKILYTIIFHAVFNFWGSIVALYVTDAAEALGAVTENPELIDMRAYLVILGYEFLQFGLIIGGIVMFISFLIQKKYTLEKTPCLLAPKQKFVCAAINWGMLFSILFFVYTFTRR